MKHIATLVTALVIAALMLGADAISAASPVAAKTTNPARTPRPRNTLIPATNSLQASLIGQTAPEFIKTKGWLNSTTMTLESQRGKVVLLDFFFHSCPPCIREMPKIMDIHEKYSKQGLVIIGVHSDILKTVADMEAKLKSNQSQKWKGRGITWPVALDGGGAVGIPSMRTSTSGATCAEYGVFRFPTKVLIDKQGKVRQIIPSPTGVPKSFNLEEEIQKLLDEK